MRGPVDGCARGNPDDDGPTGTVPRGPALVLTPALGEAVPTPAALGPATIVATGGDVLGSLAPVEAITNPGATVSLGRGGGTTLVTVLETGGLDTSAGSTDRASDGNRYR
jgi:hypothetical protein